MCGEYGLNLFQRLSKPLPHRAFLSLPPCGYGFPTPVLPRLPWNSAYMLRKQRYRRLVAYRTVVGAGFQTAMASFTVRSDLSTYRFWAPGGSIRVQNETAFLAYGAGRCDFPSTLVAIVGSRFYLRVALFVSARKGCGLAAIRG